MEAATILPVAARGGVAAACVLGVSHAVAQAAGAARGAAMASGSNGARRMSPDELAKLGVQVGEAGYAALRSP
jgi:hypothetical protein